MCLKDSRYIVPDVFEGFSSQKVLATSFEQGFAVDSEEVLSLSQERRNQLGLSFMDFYLRELLDFGLVQTDPHLGNYKIRLNNTGQDQIILLDYGAIRRVEKIFF